LFSLQEGCCPNSTRARGGGQEDEGCCQRAQGFLNAKA